MLLRHIFLVASLALVLEQGTEAAQIAISASFADLPAGTEAPATPDKLTKVKGASILSSPRITVTENDPGAVEITQDTAVPGGGQVPLGLTLSVKTSVTERGSIWFSGNLRDRSRGGGEKTEKLETVGFATREWYFSGYTNDGGTVVIRTSPATSQTVKEGKTVTVTRELVAYLKFEKIAEKPATPAKKPTPTASSKKSTVTKKAATKSTTRKR
jgi:hypothetical protein